MKTYKIELTHEANKFLAKRTAKERQKILSQISQLPNHRDVKKMKGYQVLYRLRIGDYRVLYEKLDDKLVILVVEIGNRGDVYR